MKALIFDLDGTLIDSVYPHTIAWQKALSEFGIQCPAWAVHRRIGMSGKLLVKAIAREQGRRVGERQLDELSKRHLAIFRRLAPGSAALRGARELLRFLRANKVPHGIATSGARAEISRSLQALHLGRATVVVDGDMVRQVKPEPDLFLLCQQKLAVKPADCLVVGDSVWDVHAARRCGIASVGLLSGGFAEQELYNAGAMRVYQDPRALHEKIDELGFEIG